MQELIDELESIKDYKYKELTIKLVKEKLEEEKEQIIDFHKWMLKNDTAENADKYFHYSDDDMFNEYLKINSL